MTAASSMRPAAPPISESEKTPLRKPGSQESRNRNLRRGKLFFLRSSLPAFLRSRLLLRLSVALGALALIAWLASPARAFVTVVDDAGGGDEAAPGAATLAAPAPADPITLERNAIEVTIRDQVAVARVEHVFRSRVDRILQVRYVFPLGPGAHVTGYAIWEEGVRCEGELMEVSRAEALYRRVTEQEITASAAGTVAEEVHAVRVARDPGLLRETASGSFETHIYPILPRQEKPMELLYAEALPLEDGWCAWRFPLAEAGRALRSPVGALSLAVTIADSAGVEDARCDFPGARVEPRPGGGALVTLEANDVRPLEDLVVRWRPRLAPLRPAVIAHRPAATVASEGRPVETAAGPPPVAPGRASDTRGPALRAGHDPSTVPGPGDPNGSGDGFALVRVALPAAPPASFPPRRDGLPLEIAVALDASASVSGLKRARLDDALRRLEEALRPDDRLVTIAFHSLERGVAAALARAADMAGPDGARLPLAVLASDGITEEDPDAVLAALERAPPAARLLVLASGHDDDMGLLGRLAERRGGTVWAPGLGASDALFGRPAPEVLERPYGDTISAGGGPAALDAAPLLARFRAPAVVGARLEGLPEGVEALPLARGPLPLGSAAAFLLRYERAGVLEARLRATVAGRLLDAPLVLSLPEREDAHRFLAGFHAKARVRDLLREHPPGPRDPNREEIVALSLAHRFVTPYTAFLALPAAERRRVGLREHAPAPDPDLYRFATATPEAETWALLLLGLAFAAWLFRRRAAAAPARGGPLS
jgi:hypothetical protein